jgi:hypothetical protein
MRLPEDQELDKEIKTTQLQVLKITGGLLTLIMLQSLAATIIFAGWAIIKLFQ